MFNKPFRLGILGGGQLGAMLIRHAIDFGLEVRVMDGDASAPCARYTNSFVQGSLMDYDTVVQFARGLDALTIEIESVNVDALKAVRDAGLRVFPSPELIETIQDKGTQKQALIDAGIPVAPGQFIGNRSELKQHVSRLPAVFKLRRGGYDGKGVMMLHGEADIETAFDGPCILEELVDIEQEIAVIVARNENGEASIYDPVRMVFDEKLNLLDYQVCPAGLPAELERQALNLARRVAEGLNLIGLLAIEMFVTRDGRILVNELAPRPHNSGHHTIEACGTSQYENLLRVLLGLPVGSPATLQSSVMVNIIEPQTESRDAMYSALQNSLDAEGLHLHWYGKGGGRPGRKMGHITVCADDVETAQGRASHLRDLLKG
jgi:5-(carboxyamino)imidazole ribonucleotide synthase